MGVAAALVDLEDPVVAEPLRGAAADPPDGVEDAGLEVDQGADDVEGEDFESAERHGESASRVVDREDWRGLRRRAAR
jgi:hypothetical protein